MKQIALISPGNILFIIFIFSLVAIIFNRLVGVTMCFLFIASWWYSVAHTLNTCTQNMRINFLLFEISFASTTVVFLVGSSVQNGIISIPNIENMEFILGLIYVISILIQIFLMSKLMSRNRSELLLRRIQLFYFPIGIWWLYPKYKAMIEELNTSK